MTTKIVNNGLRDVLVLMADEGKQIARIGYEEQPLGKEFWCGYSHYIGGVLQGPPHEDKQSDFCEIDDPDLDTELTDTEALNIILGNEA